MSIVCQYCLMSVVSQDIVTHISAHLNYGRFSSDYCKLCGRPVDIDSTEAIIDHMIQYHIEDRRCPICETLTINLDHLFYHLKANTNVVYHCKNMKCFFITSSIIELKQHISSFRHKKTDIYNEYNVGCGLKDVMSSLNDEESKMFSQTLKRKYLKNDTFEDLAEPEIEYIVKSKRKIIKKTFFDDNELYEDSFKPPVKSSYKTIKEIEPCILFRKFQMEYSDFGLKKSLKGGHKLLYDGLMLKIQKLRTYSIGMGSFKGMNAFMCISCNYTSQYCYEDIQKHILTEHCSLEISEVKLLMKASRFKADLQLSSDLDMISNISQRKAMKYDVKLQSEFKDNIEDTSLNKANTITQTFKIEYSERVHRKCTKELSSHERDELSKKLNDCKRFSVGVIERPHRRNFMCMECQHSSSHSYSNLRKHILTQHCGVHRRYISDFVKASKLDSLHRLLPDKEMIKCINYERASNNNWDLLSDSEEDGKDTQTECGDNVLREG